MSSVLKGSSGDHPAPETATDRMNYDSTMVSSKKETQTIALPPVGRHTSVLESKVRKNSLSEVPDAKKPKLELPMKDVNMGGAITPGAPVEDSFESPIDAEIPNSPSFTGRAKEIPRFDISDDDAAKEKETQLEHEDEQNDVDELDRNDAPPEAATPPGDHNSLPAGEFLIHNSNATAYPNASNSGGRQAGKQQGAGIATWAFGEAQPHQQPQKPLYAQSRSTDVMPPWLQERRDNFVSLHSKADRQHQDILTFGAEVQMQGGRINHLEQVASEHTLKHEDTEARLKALEKQVRQDDRDAKIQALERKILELQEAGFPDERERSPQRTGLGTKARSPSPRSPRFQPRTGEGSPPAFENEDLDIVVGGWNDARKSDATDEIRNIFKAVGCEASIAEIFTPYSRTNFAKIKLNFPQPEAHISVRRQIQFNILDKLRAKSFTSGVPGSVGNKIWSTKSKTPEERAKTRAIVLTKTYYRSLSPGEGKPCFSEDDIEISWNGKVYIDKPSRRELTRALAVSGAHIIPYPDYELTR